MTKYCGYFNGSSSYAAKASISNLPDGNNPRFMEAKFMLGESDNGGQILSYGTANSGTPIFFIEVNRTSAYIEFGSGSNATTYTFPESLSSNVWYHIGVSYDGSTFKMFFDNEEIMNITGLSINTTRTDLAIGYMYWTPSSRPFTGYITDIAVYNTSTTLDDFINGTTSESNCLFKYDFSDITTKYMAYNGTVYGLNNSTRYSVSVDNVLTEITSEMYPGMQLLTPKDGYTRIEDTDTKIRYEGSGWVSKSASGFNISSNNWHYTANKDDYVIFKFFGTACDIIGLMNSSGNTTDHASIYLDDKYVVTYNSYMNNGNNQGSYLLYSFSGLENTEHIVKIINENGNGSNTYLSIDAIDLNSDGYLMNPPAVFGDVIAEPEDGWQRIHNTNELIKYDGTWASSTYGSLDFKYSESLNAKYKFKFHGTKLRLLANLSTDRSTSNKVSIDGVDYTFSQYASSVSSDLNLVFEKTRLENSDHEVMITLTESGKSITSQDFDIDSDGYLIAISKWNGDQLSEPESGWQRIDDTNELLKYYGAWSTFSGGYNSTFQYCTNITNICKFKFNGTKLRIVNATNKNWSHDIIITIDGIAESYSSYGTTTDNLYNIIVYEKLDLTDGEHTVTIQNNEDGKYFAIDAIDIDSTGSLLQLPVEVGDQLTSVEDDTWQRITYDNEKFLYHANWSTATTNGIAYTRTSLYGESLEFKFHGTKLRVLGWSNTSASSNFDVYIDNVCYSKVSAYSTSDRNTVLNFEKLDLTDGDHIVKIVNNENGKYLFFEAIDINSDGYLCDHIGTGSVLSSPERGWQRVNDDSKCLETTSGWTKAYAASGCSGNTLSWCNNTSDYLKFSFKGTGFRIIGYNHSNRCQYIKYTIDDVNYYGTEYGSTKTNVVIFNIVGLENTTHTVKMQPASSGFMAFEAIDILGEISEPTRNIYDQLTEPDESWQRIDDANNNISYSGTWTTASHSSYYKGSEHMTTELNASVSFKFYGTKLRLISCTDSNRSTETLITIDGTQYTFNPYYSSIIYQALVFEMKDLEEKEHEVVITNPTSGLYLTFDAVDIDKTGYIISPDRNIGDKLTEPDGGWQRIEETNELIKFNFDSTWASESNSAYSGGSHKYSTDLNATIKFKFYGTKLRLISAMNKDRPESYKLNLDGEEYTFSEYNNSVLTQILVFEKLNLEKSEHTITISNTEAGKYLTLDAIDIDSDGYLVELPKSTGDILTSPEDGWKRIEETDELIKYIGTGWRTNSNGSNSASTSKYTTTSNDKIKFKFNGTKLRLIASTGADRPKSCPIIIDNIEYTLNQCTSSALYQVITFEKLDLEEKEHEVLITNTKSECLVLDAIDIDSNGYLIDTRMKINIGSLEKRVESVIYISPNGSDDNNGLSKETPVLTFNKAINLAGDNYGICFMEGEHDFTNQYVTSSGGVNMQFFRESDNFADKSIIFYSEKPSNTKLNFICTNRNGRQQCVCLCGSNTELYNLNLVFKTNDMNSSYSGIFMTCKNTKIYNCLFRIELISGTTVKLISHNSKLFMYNSVLTWNNDNPITFIDGTEGTTSVTIDNSVIQNTSGLDSISSLTLSDYNIQNTELNSKDDSSIVAISGTGNPDLNLGVIGLQGAYSTWEIVLNLLKYANGYISILDSEFDNALSNYKVYALTTELSELVKKGFNLSKLFTSTTINEETFIPFDKIKELIGNEYEFNVVLINKK